MFIINTEDLVMHNVSYTGVNVGNNQRDIFMFRLSVSVSPLSDSVRH